MANTARSTIEIAAIPEFCKRQLADGALQLTKSFFSNPQVEHEYQEWLAKRKERK